MGVRVLLVMAALGCGGAHNSDFGTPQDVDAGTLNGLPLDCSLSDATCPGGGDCCGDLCCTVAQTCCEVNGIPTCVSGTDFRTACGNTSPFGP
jgi:hypothetical protein